MFLCLFFVKITIEYVKMEGEEQMDCKDVLLTVNSVYSLPYL